MSSGRAFDLDAFDFDAFDTDRNDFFYGGIGHMLLEIEEAKLASDVATRAARARPRAIDRTTAPKFAPIGGGAS